jgi:hypothetical protein
VLKLGYVSYYVSYVDHVREDGTFWAKFFSSPPNEIGDALAGIFGSLAFLAAAIAVVMQSTELKAQRQELELTREVLKDQKKATKEMANAMTAQAGYLKEDRAELLLNASLKNLCNCLEDARNASDFCRWIMRGFPGKGYSEEFAFTFNNPDSFLRRAKLGLEDRFTGFRDCEAGLVEYDIVYYQGTATIPSLAEAAVMIDRISLLEDRLSDGEKVRLSSIGLPRLRIMIDIICANPSHYAYNEEPFPEGYYPE